MNKNKNILAGFLMLVGVVFILIAGGVFVTTAWGYLPEFVKQFFLLALTAAFFAAAVCLQKKGCLPKTELALYYLGVAFCGYCSISLLGGCHFPAWGKEDAGRLLAASLLMLVPVGYRLISEYRGSRRGLAFHMAVLLVLLDNALVWGFTYCNLGYRMQVFVAAGTLLAYALADCFGKRFFGVSLAVQILFYVEFALHALVYLMMRFSFLGESYSEAERLALVFLLLLTAYVMWRSRKQAVWRIFHSLTLLWFVYVLVLNLYSLEMLPWGNDFGFGSGDVVLFSSYLICMMLMLVMQRTEMTWILLRFASVIALIQLLSAVFGSKEYLPYSLVCMTGMFLLPLAKEYKEEGRRYLIAGVLQGLSALALFRAYQGQDLGEKVMFFWLLLTISIANSALLSRYRLWSQILWTLALFPGMSIFWTCPWVEVSEQFIIEYGCIWAELAVVLLPCIWYDKDRRDIRFIQFVLNCVLLGILLLWNLVSGELANALLLGGISMFVILLAAFFHRRNYLLAASVSLFLLVVYATRELWLNIAWWVYLLFAGVILIILASHAFSKGEGED